MGIVITIDEIKEKLKTRNLKLISKEYNGINSKIEFEDDFGYKYLQRAGSIRYWGDNDSLHTFSKRNPFSMHNLELYFKKEVRSGTKLLSTECCNKSQKIEMICGRCGKNFSQSINDFIRRNPKHLCQICSSETQRTRLTSLEKIKKEIIEHGYIINFKDEEYRDTKTRFSVINKDGYKSKMTINSIRKGRTDSPFAKYNPYAIENLTLYMYKNNYKTKIKSKKYNGWDLPIELICECGEEFTTTVTHIMSENKVRCDTCSKYKSSFEIIVENLLIEYNIKYTYQKRFDDCVNVYMLPFDYYLDELNIIIEVDGEGHFKPVRFNGCSKESALKSYRSTTRNDKIKTEYCKNNNIKLIRVSYIEINNLTFKEKILSELSIDV